MKKIISSLILSLGAVATSSSDLLAQAVDGSSVLEICTKPEYASENQKLWDFVSSQNKTEVYIAYLEVCGSSPLTAEFAAAARQIVIERTANFHNMPKKSYRISVNANSDSGFSATYVA